MTVYKILSFLLVGLFDVALLNTVYLGVLRPRIRVFIDSRKSNQSGDRGRTYNITIQNFEERELKGVLVVRVHSSADGLTPPNRVDALVGPANIWWEFVSTPGNEMLEIKTKSFRALKTWSFRIEQTVVGGDELQVEILFRPHDSLVYEFGRRFDFFGGQYSTHDGEVYFVWKGENEHENGSGNERMSESQSTPDIRSLVLSLLLTVFAYFTVVLIQSGGSLSENFPGLADWLAPLVACLCVFVAFLALRRPLFPVAQGYRIAKQLTYPRPITRDSIDVGNGTNSSEAGGSDRATDQCGSSKREGDTTTIESEKDASEIEGGSEESGH